MKSTMYFILFTLSWVVQFIGGIALAAMFFGGIYVFIMKSVLIGLAMIGGSMVGAWVINIIAGMLLIAATACIDLGD